MTTGTHLLFQIAEFEKSQPLGTKPNEAVLAAISFFRSVAQGQVKKEPSYIELSQGIDA